MLGKVKLATIRQIETAIFLKRTSFFEMSSMPYYKFFLQVHPLYYLLFLPLCKVFRNVKNVIRTWIPSISFKFVSFLWNVKLMFEVKDKLCLQIIACRFFIHLLHFKCIEKGDHYFVCFNISLMIIILPSS